MADDAELLIEHDGAVAVLTLNRPQRNNALTDNMLVMLGRAVMQLEDDGRTRAVLVKGSGGVFCAGFDVGAGHQSRTRVDFRDHADLASATFWRIWRSPLPFVAAVRKVCIGGAVYLACVCDFLVTTPETRIAMSELRLGMAPPLFNIFPWLMSYRAAKEFLLTGEAIDGRKAVEWELASRCIEADDPVPDAMRLAEQLAAMPDNVVAKMKRSVNRRWELAGLVEGINEDVAGFVEDKVNMGPVQAEFRRLAREVGVGEAVRRMSRLPAATISGDER